ncbi:hypothetical protein GCM10022235_77300 [Kribbella ginsengisoli]|uniref:Uncharacterized protein n=1 Tax=Kribbella ginsengisoli TaxID=363865 RepID=A0ABP6Z1E8_9ACTN
MDHSWDEQEREDVADYLTQGFVFRAFGGVSMCRFCGIGNGEVELTDGSWYRPEGLAHYLTDHGVRLPQVFVGHVNSELEFLEDAGTDTDWWKAQGGSKPEVVEES